MGETVAWESGVLAVKTQFLSVQGRPVCVGGGGGMISKAPCRPKNLIPTNLLGYFKHAEK